MVQICSVSNSIELHHWLICSWIFKNRRWLPSKMRHFGPDPMPIEVNGSLSSTSIRLGPFIFCYRLDITLENTLNLSQTCPLGLIELHQEWLLALVSSTSKDHSGLIFLPLTLVLHQCNSIDVSGMTSNLHSCERRIRPSKSVSLFANITIWVLNTPGIWQIYISGPCSCLGMSFWQCKGPAECIKERVSEWDPGPAPTAMYNSYNTKQLASQQICPPEKFWCRTQSPICLLEWVHRSILYLYSMHCAVASFMLPRAISGVCFKLRSSLYFGTWLL